MPAYAVVQPESGPAALSKHPTAFLYSASANSESYIDKFRSDTIVPTPNARLA